MIHYKPIYKKRTFYMDKKIKSQSLLSEKEFLYVFKTILDIGTIRSHISGNQATVDIKTEDFEEMRNFVNVYIHLLAHGLASENHRDIFSIGISSMEGDHVRRIIRGLEEKLKNDYAAISREEKVSKLVALINFAKDVDPSSIDEYMDFLELTSIIKKVRYNVDINYLKKEIAKEIA